MLLKCAKFSYVVVLLLTSVLTKPPRYTIDKLFELLDNLSLEVIGVGLCLVY